MIRRRSAEEKTRETASRMLAPRPARRVAATLAGTVAIVLLASACASTAEPVNPGVPISQALEQGLDWPVGAPVPERELEGPVEPIAWWNLGETRETLTFISYGSSACPFGFIGLEVEAADRVRVVFTQQAGDACTDDLRASHHVVAAPEGLTAAEVVADVEWREPRADGDDRVQQFTIMVIDPNVEPTFPPPSAAVDEYPGLPPLLPEPAPDAPPAETPLAYWLSPVLELASERELTIVTYGSSSCPVIPTVVDPGAGEGVIGVTLQERRAPDTFCTEDFAPFTSVLAVPLEAAARATAVEFTTVRTGSDAVTVSVPIVDLVG